MDQPKSRRQPCQRSIPSAFPLFEGSFCLTCCNSFEPGRPRSLAKDQHMREADARIPMLAHHCIVVTIEAIKAEPATEPVERKRIFIKGYPVADLMAASTSLRLNSVAINIPKPMQPLIEKGGHNRPGYD